MTQENLLEKVFGASPHLKVLQLLWIGHEFEYAVADIQDATKVTRPTIRIVLDLLLETEVIIARKLKNTTRYKFNPKHTEMLAVMDRLINDKIERIELTKCE